VAHDPVVTFDLFSALIDSRSGASAALQRITRRRGWQGTGHVVYGRWDVHNKAAQKACTTWVPFVSLSREALAVTYAELGIDGDAASDADELLASVGDWPLWPDVAEHLPALRRSHRVGILSNVDDAVLRRTRAAELVDPEHAFTSERLQAYKPGPEIYRRAFREAGRLVHVASSARDVRGALEAGVPVVRLARAGHQVDPEGPQPPRTVEGLAGLEDVLHQVHAENPDATR
jgi:2-haloacid dehalogenase